MPRAVKTQGWSEVDKGSQSAKRLKREDSPDVIIVVDSDDDNACAEDGVHAAIHACGRQPGSPGLENGSSDIQYCTSKVTAARSETSLEAGVEATAIAEDWLLDPVFSSQAGLVISIHGSARTLASCGWHDGDYEGAHGLVLSVFNTRRGNTGFASTARVRMLAPLSPDVHTFAVPVSYLRPVPPDDVGQSALIVSGGHKGHVAKLREELEGGWFVSVAYDHFEIENDRLVKVLPVDVE